jgi:hypothetical protein
MASEWVEEPRLEAGAGWYWWRRDWNEPLSLAQVVAVEVFTHGELMYRRLGREWRPVRAGENGVFAGPIALPLADGVWEN